MQLNYGKSTSRKYDNCLYVERVDQSTGHLTRQLNTDSIYNKSNCKPLHGGYSSSKGVTTNHDETGMIAPRLAAIPIDSVMSQRNYVAGSCNKDLVNPYDFTKDKKYNVPVCNSISLDPIPTQLTHSTVDLDDIEMNRFIPLHRNPQSNIYWDTASNTRLETRDNYKPKLIKPLTHEQKNKKLKSFSQIFGTPKDQIVFDNMFI